jgi:hypothetical protein
VAYGDQGQDHDVAAQLRAVVEQMNEMAAELAVLRSERGGPAVAVTDRPEPSVASGPSAPPVDTSGPEDPGDARISRRGALALGAAAAVGIGALADSVLSPTPAWATTGNMQYGASNNAGTAETDLTSTVNTETLNVINTGTGGGGAITADVTGVTNPGTVVDATTSGTGEALVGSIQNATSTAIAINGVSSGLGSAVRGLTNNPASAAAAVSGITSGSGPAVEAASTSGYGVSAQGGLAPLYLVPAAGPGAPTSGNHAAGELVVDSSGVIWLCQGTGTPGTWVPVLIGGGSNDVGAGETDLTSSSTTETLSVSNNGSGSALSAFNDADTTTISAENTGTGSVLFAEITASANTSPVVMAITLGTGSALRAEANDPNSTASSVDASSDGLGNAVLGLVTNPASVAAAIAGSHFGLGPALEGTSASGYGVSATGGLAPLFLTPAGAAGAPTSGTHAVGELYLDADAFLWVCTSAGTPGFWAPQLAGNVFNTTSEQTDWNSTGTGSTLSLSNSNATYGPAISAYNDNPAPALSCTNQGAGYGATFAGGLAPVLISPAATTGPPTTGAHALGELYYDADGLAWRCWDAGTPGEWAPQYTTVTLPAPVRVINTSTGEGGITGPLVPGSTVHTSSAVAGTNGIPVGANALVANLAVSGVGGALLNGYGVMTIFPAGEATPATANINAGAGCFALSNTVTAGLGTGADAGKVSIVWGGGGPVPNAQAYLDVIAYII